MELDRARQGYSKIKATHPTLVVVQRAVQNFETSARRSKPKRMSWLGRTGAGKSTTINNILCSTCITPEEYTALQEEWESSGRCPEAADSRGKPSHFFMKHYFYSDNTSTVRHHLFGSLGTKWPLVNMHPTRQP
jgi:hypothetical protein